MYTFLLHDTAIMNNFAVLFMPVHQKAVNDPMNCNFNDISNESLLFTYYSIQMKGIFFLVFTIIVLSSFYAKAQLPENFPTVVELTCKIRDTIPKEMNINISEEAKVKVKYYSNHCSTERYMDIVIDKITSDRFPMDSTIVIKMMQQFAFNQMNAYLADSTIRFVKIFQPIYWKTNFSYQIWETCNPTYRTVLFYIPSKRDKTTGLIARDHFELIEANSAPNIDATNCITLNISIIDKN